MYPLFCTRINSTKDKQILVEAGIITDSQQHVWVFLSKQGCQQLTESYTPQHHRKYRYVWNVYTHHSHKINTLRLTAKQFVAAYNLTRLMPNATLDNLISVANTTQRNRMVIAYHHRRPDLLDL